MRLISAITGMPSSTQSRCHRGIAFQPHRNKNTTNTGRETNHKTVSIIPPFQSTALDNACLSEGDLLLPVERSYMSFDTNDGRFPADLDLTRISSARIKGKES